MKNQKNLRYFMSMGAIAVVAALATMLVNRTQNERANAQQVEAKMTQMSPAFPADSDKNYLRQVTTIQSRMRQRKALDDNEADQLLAVIDNHGDSILQAKAFATLQVAARSGYLSEDKRNKAVDSSLAALKSQDSLARLYAISLLASLDQKRVAPQLLPLLNDPEPRVQKAAKKALQKLGYNQTQNN